MGGGKWLILRLCPLGCGNLLATDVPSRTGSSCLKCSFPRCAGLPLALLRVQAGQQAPARSHRALSAGAASHGRTAAAPAHSTGCGATGRAQLDAPWQRCSVEMVSPAVGVVSTTSVFEITHQNESFSVLQFFFL